MRKLLWATLQYLQVNTILRLQHRRIPLVVYYHGVSDVEVPQDSFRPFVSTEAFRKHLEMLGRHYHVISLLDLFNCWLERPDKLDRHVAITFDDGFLNNGTVAWPILKEYGFPATVFLATGMVGSLYGDRWRDYLATHILFSSEDEIRFSFHNVEYRLCLGNLERRQTILARVYAAVDCNPGLCQNDIDELIDVVCSQLRPQISSIQEERYRMMSWDDVRRFANDGLSFAPHTHGHVCLTRCDDARIRWELMEPRRLLCDNLGDRPEHKLLAYPYGDVNQRVAYMVNECGYKAGFATSKLVDPFGLRSMDPFLFPRLGIGADMGQTEFAAALCGARSRIISLNCLWKCHREKSECPAGCPEDVLSMMGAVRL